MVNKSERRRRYHRWALTVINGGLPNGVEHGANAYVYWGCRCDRCRAGNRQRMADYRARKATS